jgi:hypothetical protein
LTIAHTATNLWFYYPLAVLGATLCICRHLEWMSSQGNTASGRRNSIRFESTLCLVVPLASIPIRASLSVFSPGPFAGHLKWNHRIFSVPIPLYYPRTFWLCRGHVSLSPRSRAHIRTTSRTLCSLLHLCRSVICTSQRKWVRDAPLSAMATCNLIRRRYFSGSLRTSKTALSGLQFLRLLALCLIMGIWPTIAISLTAYLYITFVLFPWPGWRAVHVHFTRVLSLPVDEQPAAVRRIALLAFWQSVASTYLVAVLLAFGEDVRSDVGKAWSWFVPHRRRTSTPSSSPQRGNLVSEGDSPSSLTMPSEWFEESLRLNDDSHLVIALDSRR